jgi:replicative DNA helicase
MSTPALSPKLPPQAIEAEQSVLGGLMMHADLFGDVRALVSVDDFYRHDHRLIFAAMETLNQQNDPIDALTLSNLLNARGQLQEAGGSDYLSALVFNVTTAGNVEAYARMVREKSILRALIEAGSDIADKGYFSHGLSVNDLLADAEQKIFRIAEMGSAGKSVFLDTKTLLKGVLEHINLLHAKGSTITGLPTGYHDFDDKTAGLQKGDLIILAGRPSMGKTTFAMNIAEQVAVDGHAVAVFSLEMPAQQLLMRMMCSVGRIDATKMRTAQLGDDEWARMPLVLSKLNSAQLYIDDTSGLSAHEVRARARRLHADLRKQHGDQHPGLGLIVIDYLQLMRGSTQTDNRTAEISEISRSLKSMARELNVPVIALSQLNRSLESRSDKRPMNSDLRESGAIEQDADVIVFVYRNEVYHPEDVESKGKAEIIIGKQRNGPIGTVNLVFHGHYTRFDNAMREYQERY